MPPPLTLPELYDLTNSTFGLSESQWRKIQYAFDVVIGQQKSGLFPGVYDFVYRSYDQAAEIFVNGTEYSVAPESITTVVLFLCIAHLGSSFDTDRYRNVLRSKEQEWRGRIGLIKEQTEEQFRIDAENIIGSSEESYHPPMAQIGADVTKDIPSGPPISEEDRAYMTNFPASSGINEPPLLEARDWRQEAEREAQKEFAKEQRLKELRRQSETIDLRNSGIQITPGLAAPTTPADSLPEIARILSALRAESTQTLEDIAAETKFNVSTIHRHETGKIVPRGWRITTYERVYSEILQRQVVIPQTPIKRKKRKIARK